jgi:long-chain acyl-CoA synthetase
MNLIELLEHTAGDCPRKPALIDGSEEISYRALLDEAAASAARLQELGVTSGMRIGLCLPNSIAYVALTFALWKARAVVVPVPVECTGEDIEELSRSMELAGLITREPRSSESRKLSERSEHYFSAIELPRPADNHGLNLAFIRFTSGTTSARKGVAVAHETIRDRIVAANKALGITREDTVMWCLPMSHHFLITIVLYVAQGATTVLSRHVVARSFLEAINRHRGTLLYAAPFHYSLLARDGSGVGLPTVRRAISTTCSLPGDVTHDFHKRFGIPLLQGLGIIEVGLVALNSEADAVAKWDSVGRPSPDFQIKILEPDENDCGEVAVRGPGFLDAYAAPWIPRERILRDGWFVTGDIGRIDSAGCLFLAGRKTAVINLAGRKVFPEEIESVLNRHPDVRESRVYGRVHPHLGEVVEAEIVLEHPEARLDSLREFCRAHLASFKVPTRLHVVSSLPRTLVTGKIRREAAVA